jgi:hypothetical protein
LLGIPNVYFEHMAFPKYMAGQYYRLHHDYYSHHVHQETGPRVIAMVLYLNTIPMEAGGGTYFPMWNVTIQPRQGTALLLPLVVTDDIYQRDDRTFLETLMVRPYLIHPELLLATNSGHDVNDDDGQYVRYVADLMYVLFF